jgi:hypothetical protein
MTWKLEVPVATGCPAVTWTTFLLGVMNKVLIDKVKLFLGFINEASRHEDVCGSTGAAPTFLTLH